MTADTTHGTPGSPIRLGGGQAFFTEPLDAAMRLIEDGVHYLVCDALAEYTLAWWEMERQRDESLGYDTMLAARVAATAPAIAAGATKLITNGGGMNILQAQRAVLAACRDAGETGIRVGVVMGDDVLERAQRYGVAADARFANVYLGADGIARVLGEGADIVLTGRVADASLFLGPLIHEFGWASDDWDRMATGITVGHVLECSAQATGGNYSGDWWNTVDMADMGYPVAEVFRDGTAVITKPPGSGGRVSFDTVREQLLYEVHDPSAYLNPDVTADFTSVQVTEEGPDRVRLSEIRGAPAPATLKGIAGRSAGWCGEVRFGFTWPDAYEKSRFMIEQAKRRAEQIDLEVLEWCEEYFGLGAYGGPTTPPPPAGYEPPEVIGRLAWRTREEAEARRLLGSLGTLGVGGPPHLMWLGQLSNVTQVTEKLSVEAFAVPREDVEIAIHIEDI